jgi:hypothetical protein
MPLEVHPCVESDFADFSRIYTLAFSSGLASYITPRPVTEKWRKRNIEKMIKSFKTEPDVRYIKVIDTEKDGKMIACAKWRLNEKERTEEQIQSMLPVPGADEEGRPAAQDFLWYLHRVRREYMGTKPYNCKHVLIEGVMKS